MIKTKSGSEIAAIYNRSGQEISAVYDKNGNLLFSSAPKMKLTKLIIKGKTELSNGDNTSMLNPSDMLDTYGATLTIGHKSVAIPQVTNTAVDLRLRSTKNANDVIEYRDYIEVTANSCVLHKIVEVFTFTPTDCNVDGGYINNADKTFNIWWVTSNTMGRNAYANHGLCNLANKFVVAAAAFYGNRYGYTASGRCCNVSTRLQLRAFGTDVGVTITAADGTNASALKSAFLSWAEDQSIIFYFLPSNAAYTLTDISGSTVGQQLIALYNSSFRDTTVSAAGTSATSTAPDIEAEFEEV